MEVAKRGKAHGGGKRSRRKKVPAARLVARTKASRRHPKGMPRCQFSEDRDGDLWQCPKAARAGFRVCGSHGAGYAKREREGTRQNPALAALKTGEHADSAAMEEYLKTQEAFTAMYEAQLRSPSLLDYREEVAMGKALLRWFVQTARLLDTDNSFGKTPPALAAIDRLEKVLAIGDRAIKIEAQLGVITHEQLRYERRCVVETMDRFIPADRHDEAKQFLRERLSARSLGGVGGLQTIEGGRGRDAEGTT